MYYWDWQGLVIAVSISSHDSLCRKFMAGPAFMNGCIDRYFGVQSGLSCFVSSTRSSPSIKMQDPGTDGELITRMIVYPTSTLGFYTCSPNQAVSPSTKRLASVHSFICLEFLQGPTEGLQYQRAVDVPLLYRSHPYSIPAWGRRFRYTTTIPPLIWDDTLL